MLIRLLSTSSVLPCRPASGDAAVAMLVLGEWGGFVRTGKLGGALAIAGFYFINLISLIHILVTIFGLLIQIDLHDTGGQCRRRPGLT